jgi:DNA-binding CsgD family transcriptional regulator
MSPSGTAARAPTPLRPAGAAARPWAAAGAFDPAALERLVGACLEVVGDECLERLLAVGLELVAGAARAKRQPRRAARLAGAIAALAGGGGLAPVVAAPPGSSPRPAALPAREGWGPLSAREREVALLIAEGLTNRRIAEQLVISERTADTHVQHILSKLGLGCRAQIAAWVATRTPR